MKNYQEEVRKKYPDAKASKIEDDNLETEAWCIEATKENWEVDALPHLGVATMQHGF